MNMEEILKKIIEAIETIVSDVPESKEKKSSNPVARSREICNKAATKAAITSGSLAIPPGPAGLITILPDLIVVWKIQSQMVADIAGTFGKKANLSKEQMIYCLFKHAGGQVVRDIVVRAGERLLVRKTTLRALKQILQKIGVRITQRIAGKVLSRFIIIAGAILMAAYAYYDTIQVSKTSIDFFKHEIVNENDSEPPAAVAVRK